MSRSLGLLASWGTVNILRSPFCMQLAATASLYSGTKICWSHRRCHLISLVHVSSLLELTRNVGPALDMTAAWPRLASEEPTTSSPEDRVRYCFASLFPLPICPGEEMASDEVSFGTKNTGSKEGRHRPTKR